MDFFNRKFSKKAQKLNVEKESEKEQDPDEQPKKGNDITQPVPAAEDPTRDIEDDEDDDIIGEVKRRLKELRKNSFMVLIPEEPSCPEEEEEESCSSEWRDSEAEDGSTPISDFNNLYGLYNEKMLFFDKMSAQQLQEAGSISPSNPSPKSACSNPSPRSASRKLALSLRCFSLKRQELQGDDELLNEQPDDPDLDLETAYVAQICLTWEALYCQYQRLSQKILTEPESITCSCYAVQQFQQFVVLLQRFIENEPFEQGNRLEIYARTRNSLPKLLQVPCIEDLGQKEAEEDSSSILAIDLMRIIEDSIFTFRQFLKMDKIKSGGTLNLFGGRNQVASALQQIKTSLDKKEIKLKEFCRKKKGWKKKSWPATPEEVELLFGLIDIKLVSRVLRMVRISKEQLIWCEEKINKLDLSDGKFHRDASPVLFPC